MRIALKVAIIRSGKTQRQVAATSGIPESRLSSIVHGWFTPTKAEQATLARILAQPTTALFTKASVQARGKKQIRRASADT